MQLHVSLTYLRPTVLFTAIQPIVPLILENKQGWFIRLALAWEPKPKLFILVFHQQRVLLFL